MADAVPLFLCMVSLSVPLLALHCGGLRDSDTIGLRGTQDEVCVQFCHIKAALFRLMFALSGLQLCHVPSTCNPEFIAHATFADSVAQITVAGLQLVAFLKRTNAWN